MPAHELAWRTDDAVLWACTGRDNYGNPVIAEPVQLKVRWQFKRMDTINSKGDPISLDAQIIVDREIPIDSLMWLGTISQWNTTGVNSQSKNLMQVVTSGRVKDLRGMITRRELGLRWWNDDNLPSANT